ncbi:MAG: hypothetical protein COV29_02770 [Candidatus Yanofskybacteria bacterium CG10_big_fil_rev_8_21_14_0_10_36_16]|uniref:UPF0102 protein COV29_02770 n=1 Tax=Candidatus Yanofskybacteria bacterium CG10_big_fil_rev_8_21_14_0_10_36_16 TaxID=1975096 RepID=A0A2J0Q7W3_9BACT|nr:MAG: hypothetical protein COV29_02770 [Candidatus Yanofskybacteria bacterium CG10_big_fil_rev_8_21_14_0_10_36_16]
MNTKDLGNLAENIATRYLQEKGYEILEKNYEMSFGEIDIIAKGDSNDDHSAVLPSKILGAGKIGDHKNDDAISVIIFVEVKANKKDYGPEFDPETRVNSKKYEKLVKTAMYYMDRELGGVDLEWRIDIVSVVFDKKNQKAKLKHFKNV